jgi:hypothetical protein
MKEVEVMSIKQGQAINYKAEKWNIQADYKDCDVKNKCLLSIKNDGLQVVDIICGDAQIEATIKFDAKDTPVKLTGIPSDFTNLSVLICNTQNRIALYINGELHDEDWPIGKAGLESSVCESSLGDWNIHDDFSFNQNYLKNPGEFSEIKNIQNWRPDGHNTGVGDCMPFAHDGVYHLFYLFDRRGHRSKWNLGAHQWAHISTRDFKKWEHHPMALAVDEQYEGSICTGSVVYHKGLFYAFYAVRMSDGSPARMSWATSPDCINFTKSNKYFELSAKYDAPSARDPMVIIDASGTAHIFVTTSLSCGKDWKGCLAHLTSADMLNWEEKEPIVTLDTGDQPECTDYFYHNGRYYLIYSIRGVARYYMSKDPFGPWEDSENNIIIHADCRVPKTAKFKDRVIAAGFLVVPEERRYAGEVIFNEMVQQPDGTFKCIVPQELL